MNWPVRPQVAPNTTLHIGYADQRDFPMFRLLSQATDFDVLFISDLFGNAVITSDVNILWHNAS